MTGGLSYFENLADDPPYDRIRLDFEGGRHLAYTNRRMLGRVGLADDADRFIEAEELGPDALDPAFDEAAFAAALAGRRRDVKSVLMDQALLAGIGNIYADEILFQARLHPKARVEGLTKSERSQLFRAIKDVLATAIECGAGAEQFLDRLPKGYLLPQRDRDGRCPPGGPLRDAQVIGPHELLLPAAASGSPAADLTGSMLRGGALRHRLPTRCGWSRMVDKIPTIFYFLGPSIRKLYAY